MHGIKDSHKLHLAQGVRLTGVAGGTWVKGYVNLKFWLKDEEERWIEFVEEAWVLKDLKVPLLLGEDFHINYQISTICNEQGSCLSLHQHLQPYSSQLNQPLMSIT